jgi:hypothetical protein
MTYFDKPKAKATRPNDMVIVHRSSGKPVTEMPRRQDNIEFEQVPVMTMGSLPNGEAKYFILTAKCKDCDQRLTLVPATGKQCQKWINLMRLSHDTCHVEIIMKEESK